MPLKKSCIDCIFCTGTLEHVEYPEIVIKEIVSSLKDRGIVYIDVPFIQCFHPDPVDFWRFTKDGLELLCNRNGLSSIETGVNIGSASAFTWVTCSFLDNLLQGSFLLKLIRKILVYCIIPFKYLDKLTVKSNQCELAASAVYYYGEKGSDK